MKVLFFIIGLIVILLPSCSTPKYLMTNCKDLGNNVYECEHLNREGRLK